MIYSIPFGDFSKNPQTSLNLDCSCFHSIMITEGVCYHDYWIYLLDPLFTEQMELQLFIVHNGHKQISRPV